MRLPDSSHSSPPRSACSHYVTHPHPPSHTSLTYQANPHGPLLPLRRETTAAAVAGLHAAATPAQANPTSAPANPDAAPPARQRRRRLPSFMGMTLTRPANKVRAWTCSFGQFVCACACMTTPAACAHAAAKAARSLHCLPSYSCRLAWTHHLLLSFHEVPPGLPGGFRGAGVQPLHPSLHQDAYGAFVGLSTDSALLVQSTAILHA